MEVKEGEGRQAILLAFPPSIRWLPSGSRRAEGAPVDQRGAQMDRDVHAHTLTLTHMHTHTQSLTCHMLSHLHRHQAACNPRALRGIRTYTHTDTVCTHKQT